MASLQKPHELIMYEALDRVFVHLLSIKDLKPIEDWRKGDPVKQSLSSIPKGRRKTVLDFRLVGRAFNVVYRRRIYHEWSFERLPTEILDKILGHLVPQPNILAFDNRFYLSLESFASIDPGPHPESNPEAEHLQNFRLINRQCDYVGARRQFARLSVQFSVEGFIRLQNIAENARLARHVVKLSYMVPRYYLHDKEWFEGLLETQRSQTRDLEKQFGRRQPRQATSHLSDRLKQSKFIEGRIRKQMEKADKQRQIVDNHMDSTVLLFALRAFTSLQQIRLMPLENESDKQWFKYLKRYHPADADKFSWAKACEHAVNTLVRAVLQSNSMVQRFSCRLMILQAPLSLTQDSTLNTELNIATGIARLKCLELHVVDPMHLEGVRAQLSGLCKAVLTRAINLEGLHIGFRDRVSIPLESVFNNVKLEKLKYIGIHMWTLHDDEIIKFLCRHRDSIKVLRLRNVLLKENSRWDRILKVIRQDLKPFEKRWISLRGAGYVGTQRFGAVFDDSDSDSDMHLDEELVEGTTAETNGINHHANEDDSSDLNDEDEAEASSMSSQASDTNEDDDSESEASSDTPQNSQDQTQQVDSDEDIGSESDGENDGEGSEAGQALHDNFISDSTMVDHSTMPESPIIPQNRSREAHSSCQCLDGMAWDDLEDDGIGVSKLRWKYWEKWAKRRCELHDPKSKGEET